MSLGWRARLKPRFLALFTSAIWLTLVQAICTVASANTVTTERTEATLLSQVKTVHAGQNFWLMLHIRMQPGWHTYWKNPGDSGTPPQLSWVLPNGLAAGDLLFLAPEREKIGPLVDYAYSTDAYFPVQITPPSILRENATSIFMLKAEWLVCKDICIPEKGDLSLALPTTALPQGEQSADAPLFTTVLG